MPPEALPSAGFEASWLCPTPLERARILELDERLGRYGNLTAIFFPGSCILAAFWVGPWALLPLVAGPMFGAAGKLMPRMRKPEWLLLTALVTFIITVGIASAQTGGWRSPLIFWVIFYLVGVSSRFARRGAIVLTTLGVAVAAGAVIVADPINVDDALPTLVAILAVGFLASRYTQVLARTEFDHREAALLDPLTGLLNRTALESRFEELRQQAVQIGGPISLVICDLDRFKQINDEHGHDCGDAVLKDVGYALRGKTRSFELIYRLGGEEFLLVLPGAELDEARQVAERLRTSLATAMPGGVAVTASFGVSSARGEEIEFEHLFHEADQALYAAKDGGRDAVVTAGRVDGPVTTASHAA
jgi:diguanylate cyclase (GGDEF)-like protein